MYVECGGVFLVGPAEKSGCYSVCSTIPDAHDLYVVMGLCVFRIGHRDARSDSNDKKSFTLKHTHTRYKPVRHARTHNL